MRDKTETFTIMGEEHTVRLLLKEEGEQREIRGKHEIRKQRIGQVYAVMLDETLLGYVHRRMVTRETRSKGKRYVNSRWESPGWLRSDSPTMAWSYAESTSLKQAARSLLWEYLMAQRERA